MINTLKLFKRSFHSSLIRYNQSFPLKQQSNNNRDLILSILNLTTTKRETNTYLNKYSASVLNDSDITSPFRLVFIKIRSNFFNLNQEHLKKFQLTLSYLIKLGNLPVILLDSSDLINYQSIHQNDNKVLNFQKIDNYLFDQFNLLSNLWNKELDLIPVKSSLFINKEVKIDDEIANFLLKENKLKKNFIPILFPYIYDSVNSKNLLCDSSLFLKHLIDNLKKLNTNHERLSVEKIIFIDELGGIPSIERLNNSHVFINLNQEYNEILAELHIGHLSLKDRLIHINNLNDMDQLLDLDSTGLITTLDIAIENLNSNPIIYNILTDRSLVSSSLSIDKISNNDIQKKVIKTTMIKKGLSVQIYNDLKEIDLTKLKNLIDESFKRSLNLDHYLNRISKIINKIIIIGDYDGCAIITNESANGKSFPYLDKFAVSKKSQGSLGVADMIFNILVKNYSSDVFLWRSKKKNPVNGWYFQRSNGSLNLPNSEFRLFWNGEKRFNNDDLEAFIEITQSIEPSFE